MNPTAAALVAHFGMTPLPVEGTWFVSTWRSEPGGDLPDGGPVGTAMIGLYTADPPSRSLFHRLTHDEVWHFYGGHPIRLVLLHPDGTDEVVTLGPDPLHGHRVQFVIPAGTWQAGELQPGGEWALFGCTMAPGFTGTCFEGGTATALVATHPQRAADIDRLAVPADEPTAMPEGFAT
ncbi:MAG: cupin domain-containing protein [Ilumatobacteraceae bacterium]|nr:cupin domain-containing protein [Ilumatobacter sp.]MCO5328619.1 cupin domain-containing protein [Ilumatobacteraceae bacterium]